MESTDIKAPPTGEEIEISGRAALMALRNYVKDAVPEASRWSNEQYCTVLMWVEHLEAELGRLEANQTLYRAMERSLRRDMAEHQSNLHVALQVNGEANERHTKD